MDSKDKVEELIDLTDDNSKPFEINDQMCQKLVEEFVSCTSSDEALAQFYLQDRHWDLQTSLNDYFDHIGVTDRDQRRERQRNAQNDDQSGGRSDGQSDHKRKVKQMCAESDAKLVVSPLGVTKDDKTSIDADIHRKHLAFITWNIDGLNEKNIRVRTEAVCDIIKREKSCVVFLQEVIAMTERILRQSLPQYTFCSSDTRSSDYYCLTLLLSDCVQLEHNQVIDFDNTSMGRSLLRTDVTVGSAKLCLLNTHLESTKEFAAIRMSQLKKSFRLISTIPENYSVIFAGDLNLRDQELQSIGGLPSGISDVWISTGRRKECEYTWDQTRNDNLQALGASKWRARCRFDRVYLRESTPVKINGSRFGLIGLERLKPNVCFPSDHWGIVCLFDIS